ncbi:15903_t:CDS:2 [Entrophospora sp. SA101]|nr:15903_t:CDS:2 [Entrophospora sp. SA101]
MSLFSIFKKKSILNVLINLSISSMPSPFSLSSPLLLLPLSVVLEMEVVLLISQKSIEESILARAQYKLDIDDKVIQAGKFDNKSTAEEREALLQMLFKQMDIERNQKEEEEWRKKGGKGTKPERLIQESELPPIYLKDYESIMRDEEETTTLLGRGKRARIDVRYDDGLTEKQWMNSLEDDEIDEMKRLETKRRRKEKKSHEKSLEQEQDQ